MNRRDVIIGFLGGTMAAAPARAQDQEDLWGGKRRFAAKLSADHQTTLTDSDATGEVSIEFDIASKTMSWEITHRGLTSAVKAVRLHGPAQAGTNAAPIIDLGGNGLISPIRGNVAVAAGHVQYLLLGWTYVSIATARYPDGEIRGKVDVVPPAAFKRWTPPA